MQRHLPQPAFPTGRLPARSTAAAALAMATGLALVAAQPARAGGCDTSCPSDGVIQLDACGPPAGLTFDPNGGCSENPPKFQFVPTEKPICGTVGGYTDAQGLPARDEDWFVFSVLEPSVISVTVRQRSVATGEPSPAFVLTLFNSPDCATQTILSLVSGAGCPLKTADILVQPGEYVFAVTVDAFGPGDPGTECPIEYVARIDVDQVHPACTGATNNCLNNASSPGCSNSACCTLVCGTPAYAYCCTVAWDAYCAAEAAMQDACAGDGCPRARGKAAVAKFLIDRARGKMLQPSPDLLDVHQQLTTAIALSTAARNQLPQPGQAIEGCQALNTIGADLQLAIAATASDAARADVEAIITQPGLPPDQVASLVKHALGAINQAYAAIDLVLLFLSPCPADLNGDTLVDAADLGIMLGGWGTGGLGDIDASGTIDGADLSILLGAWGACPAGE
jgi:hypothetical protein